MAVHTLLLFALLLSAVSLVTAFQPFLNLSPPAFFRSATSNLNIHQHSCSTISSLSSTAANSSPSTPGPQFKPTVLPVRRRRKKLGTGKLDKEIANVAFDIKAEKKKLEEERRGGKDEGIIEDLKESLTDLRAKEAALHAERKELQHDLATQSSQGKSSTCVCALNELV